MELFCRVMQTVCITICSPSLKKLKLSYYLCLVVMFSIITSSLYGQRVTPLKMMNLTPVITPTLANNSGNEGFIATDNKLFRVKIYTLSEAKVGEINHWFFRLLDKDGKELNHAQIKLSGYLKTDSSKRLNHAGKIMPLGSDGKYIIKSVEVGQKGIWILKANINNMGKQDTITYEIEVNH